MSMESTIFKKAKRRNAHLRLALIGCAGAGKTLSALYFAFGLTNDWDKIVLIDTENERSLFYANRPDLDTGEFLHTNLNSPFTPKRYIELSREAQKIIGEDGVIIIDSFSHAWDNVGGILEYKENLVSKTAKNDFTAWSEVTKIQNSFINTLMSINCHLICTMRTKTAWEIITTDSGKKIPQKIGLEPVQRNNIEYEFDLSFNINSDHIANVSKNTLFLSNFNDFITPDIGKQVHDWLAEGIEPIRCNKCRNIVTSVNFNNGKYMSVDEIAELTKTKYNEILCYNCVKENVKK